LTSSSVDGVSVELAVLDVESHSSDVLVTEDTGLGCPLESRDHGFLNFVHVLDSLGSVNNDVGSSVVRSKAPDLSGVFFFPSEFFRESFSSSLDVLSGEDFSVFNE